MTKKIIKAAAMAHAKKVLGEEQFKKNKEAVKAIVEDFQAGCEWFVKATIQNEKI